MIEELLTSIVGLKPTIELVGLQIILLFLTVFFAYLIPRAVKRLLVNVSANKAFKRVFKRQVNVQVWIPRVLRVLLYAFGILFILSKYSVTGRIITSISLLIILVVLFGFLLDFITFLPNVMAGYRLRRAKAEQSKLRSPLFRGVISDVRFLETVVHTKTGVLFVPNRVVLNLFRSSF